jgi:adenosine deaminase
MRWLRRFLEGFRIGREGRGITVRFICSAMRQQARSVEIAELAVRHRDAGVGGFDIAGPEAGFPPTRHLDAFQWCGAERLGHGVRIADDITATGEGGWELGRLAGYVRDRRIPLEMCPTSNVQTGAVRSIEDHPFDLLRHLRFRVTVNTDNRLMSGVTLSGEFGALNEAFKFDLEEMRWLTLNAMKSAFLPFDERLALIDQVIKPGYATLLVEAPLR